MKILAISSIDWYLYNYRMPTHKILREQGHETVMVSPPGDYHEAIQENGFKWRPVHMSRSGLSLKDQWKSIKELEQIIREEKPDVIHNFQMKGNILGSIAARRAGHKNIVNSITGLGYVFTGIDWKAKVIKPFAIMGYQYAMKNTKVIFQNGNDLKAFIEKKMAKKENGYLIRSSGVNLKRFKVEPYPDDPFTVLFPSRLIWSKGVGDLVEAARIVRKDYPDIEFCFAGDIDEGNPATLTRAEMQAWHDEGVINWVGFERDMPKRMANCHVIGFPSKHPEGTPKCLIEGAACSRPIVTTYNRGCTEVVEDGLNGFLVERADVKGIAEAVIKIYKDRDMMERMGKESRKIAMKHFSVEMVAENSLKVYQSELK